MAIKKGDKIKVNYTGSFEDGTVFDTSMHGDHGHPLEFTVGEGQLIKGFDDAVIGMVKDEEKTFTVLPKDGYGEVRPDLLTTMPRKGVPEDAEVGMTLGLQSPDGKQFPAKIAALDADTITLDLNHPLAGKTLIFKIQIVEC